MRRISELDPYGKENWDDGDVVVEEKFRTYVEESMMIMMPTILVIDDLVADVNLIIDEARRVLEATIIFKNPFNKEILLEKFEQSDNLHKKLREIIFEIFDRKGNVISKIIINGAFLKPGGVDHNSIGNEVRIVFDYWTEI